MAIPQKAARPDNILETLREGNEKYVGKNEWLSDNIYYYDLGKDILSIYEP